MYRVFNKRSNTTASFAGHLKFPEQMTCVHAIWVNSSKSKKLKSGHYTF